MDTPRLIAPLAEREPVTPSAMNAARYLLASQYLSPGEDISNLKLQKLLYYAQGYHLALFGEPLFPDTIRAWGHGPVVREVYDTYKEFEASPIEVTEPAPELPDNASNVLDGILQSYGRFTAWALRDMTHKEAPWLAASKSGGAISQAGMETYFRSVLSKTPAMPSTMATILRDPDKKAELDQALRESERGHRIKWGALTSSPST